LYFVQLHQMQVFNQLGTASLGCFAFIVKRFRVFRAPLQQLLQIWFQIPFAAILKPEQGKLFLNFLLILELATRAS
ncbi:hypothetical protein, partial [Pedobacter steynii]